MTYKLGKKAWNIVKKYGYNSKDVMELRDRYRALTVKRNLSLQEMVEHKELKFVVASFNKQDISYRKKVDRLGDRD